MRYFYDTEFLEDGKTIELISIGIVAEDGREYYAINVDAPRERIAQNEWLMENVVPHLPRRSDRAYKSRAEIAFGVSKFLRGNSDEPVELWADYAAYDHVVLCQLWGRMIELPKGLPMYTNDLQQRLRDLGGPRVPEQETGHHNALDDARHVKAVFDYLAPKAQRVNTHQELAVMPDGTVIRDWNGGVGEKRDFPLDLAVHYVNGITCTNEEIVLPATVLYVPEAGDGQ